MAALDPRSPKGCPPDDSRRAHLLPGPQEPGPGVELLAPLSGPPPLPAGPRLPAAWYRGPRGRRWHARPGPPRSAGRRPANRLVLVSGLGQSNPATELQASLTELRRPSPVRAAWSRGGRSACSSGKPGRSSVPAHGHGANLSRNSAYWPPCNSSAGVLVFDQELNALPGPGHRRGRIDLKLRILDRTQLILDIFAQRAQLPRRQASRWSWPSCATGCRAWSARTTAP